MIGLSAVGKPLFARYDLDAVADRFTPDAVAGREAGLWRYEEVLPVRNRSAQVKLGESWTPLIDAPRCASRLGVSRVWIKDEGQNPTGSFKDRGLCLAVSRALELGAKELALPSAGNAGSAAAAYGAAAGLRVHVVVPSDTPRPILEEMAAFGADVELLDGLISDCGKVVRKGVEQYGWFDLSTLKEPYRVEGKKTTGYELHEQLGGATSRLDRLPYRRWHRSDRDVEGLRRNGASGLDRLRATQDVHRSGLRLRAHGAGVGGRAGERRDVARSHHVRLGSACARGGGGLPHPAGSP